MDPELKKELIDRLQQQVATSLDEEMQYLFGLDTCSQWETSFCGNVILETIERVVNETLT